MLLTGFDSKYLNTLYVDKNLKHHGLIQAFSRTNRVLNGTKPYGNILDFRQHGLATAALQTFVDGILQRMIFDGGDRSQWVISECWPKSTTASIQMASRKLIPPSITKAQASIDADSWHDIAKRCSHLRLAPRDEL